MRKRYFSVRIARRDSARQDFSPELITESKHFVHKKRERLPDTPSLLVMIAPCFAQDLLALFVLPNHP
jgi:hypothetical protein